MFFSFYYDNTFAFYINGNGGFIGNHINITFLNNLINSYQSLFYYFFIFSVTILFLISINFNIKNFIQSIKKIIQIIIRKDTKNYTKYD